MENETKQCPKCKEAILSDATKCKHCGADLRNWFAKHKILTGLLVLLAIGIVIGAASPNSKGSSSTQEASKVAPKPTEAPLKVSVKEIGNDFESNQVAAESKWGGKLVEFKAEISNITESGLAFQNVTSKDFSLAQISCRVKDKTQLLSLKKGQMVTVQGVIGKQTIGVIDLGDCRVVE